MLNKNAQQNNTPRICSVLNKNAQQNNTPRISLHTETQQNRRKAPLSANVRGRLSITMNTNAFHLSGESDAGTSSSELLW